MHLIKMLEKPCKDNFFFSLIHRATNILRFIKNRKIKLRKALYKYGEKNYLCTKI